jgi:hypothetical protein
MVTAKSGARATADVDRAGTRVIGIAGTPPSVWSGMLKHTTIAPVTPVEEAVAAMCEDRADAFALGRDSLPPYLSQVPARA